jgi:hypothetical protein
MCKRYRGWTRDSASANLVQALILAGPATARWLNPWLRIGGPAQGLGGLSSSSKTARASLSWSRLPPLSGRSPIGRWRGCSGWRSAEPVDQRLRLGGDPEIVGADRHQLKVFHQGKELEAEVHWPGAFDHARLQFAQHHRGQKQIGGCQGSQSLHHRRMALDRRHEDVGIQQEGHGKSTQIRCGFGRGVVRNNQIGGRIGPEGFEESGGVDHGLGNKPSHRAPPAGDAHLHKHPALLPVMAGGMVIRTSRR